MHWIGSKVAHEWDMPLWTDQYQAKGVCSKVAHVVYATLEQSLWLICVMFLAVFMGFQPCKRGISSVQGLTR